ncbi:putative acyl-activating enzyme 17 [Nymphaea thermarum]|nr:putative acyl-activating enzyme 17 [Nymphaea thermarum]
MGIQSLEEISVSAIEDLGIPSSDAVVLHEKLGKILRECGDSRVLAWKQISRKLLEPSLPFSFHQMMYYRCYRGWDAAKKGLPPAWVPDEDDALLTNIGCFLKRHGKELLGSKYKDPISSFTDFQEFSVMNPEVYWKMVFDELNISFSVPPTCILGNCESDEGRLSYPGGQWLPGAMMNAAENCLTSNGKRNLHDTAIIWRDEGSDSLPLSRMTFKELHAEGSAIAIDMPMNIKAVIIYLAIVLAGYVVVSIADSFAPPQISTRLRISNARIVFTQDVIIRGEKILPLYSRVIEASAPRTIVISAKGPTVATDLRDCDMSWDTFIGKVEKQKANDYISMQQPIEAFTNILFSSGTTGEPKAIPWTHATPLKAAADGWAHLDIRTGDVVAWPTNLGWMMGPWLVYASLINGATMALYNGSPLAYGFAKFVQDAKVTMLGVVPSIVRAWKNSNSVTGLDWSSVSSTGEASNVDEYLWLMGRALYKPVIEYCGGTEIGGGFVSGSLVQPQSLAAFSTPAMGCKLYILGDDGNPLPQSVPAVGELALDPTMFGASTTLLNADHYKVYFEGMPIYNGKVLRRHGDEFERTVGGFYRAHGRADDTMNLGGIKVSSIEIERICNGVDDGVLETAAIGVPPLGGGPEQLVIAVVFKDANFSSEADLSSLKKAFNSSLQRKLNPLFRVSHIVVMPSLPRTASNKIMRRVLRQQLSQTEQSPKM